MREFVWNDAKAASNRTKHGISFETATRVFEDPNSIFKQDRDVDGERRWQVTGLVNGVLVLFVAHTSYAGIDGTETIRIISARRATRQERNEYDRALYA